MDIPLLSLKQYFPRTLYASGYENPKKKRKKFFSLSIMILAHEYFYKVF